VLISFSFSDVNDFILTELYDQRTSWEKYDDYNDNTVVYTGYGYNDNMMFIKIEREIEFKKEDLFKVIKDIESYNLVLTNKNIFSDLVKIDEDVIYAHQLITNVIPLVRNRQYVFKMYSYNESRIDWTLVDSKNKIMEGYLGKNVHNLYYGAGSWHLSSDNILSYRMYIDDEAKLPNAFIKKIRINSTLDVFNDVLNYIDKKEN
jgi:hypothetical protein